MVLLCKKCCSFSFYLFIVRIKALLLHLVKAFFFELAVDPSDLMRNELYVLLFSGVVYLTIPQDCD